MKNLVVFSDKLLHVAANTVKTTGSFTIQMDALAQFFDEVILCTPTISDQNFNGLSFSSNNISFSPLPNYSNRIDFILSLPKIIKIVNVNIKQSDLTLIIPSGYVGLVASIICQFKKVPIFQWIISDWGKTVVARQHSQIAKLIAVKFIKPFLDWLIFQLTKNTLTFYNGKIPANHRKPYHYTRISSSIKEVNLSFQVNTKSIVPPLTLLFVGRLSPEKGIKYLIEALLELNQAGIDTVLHIAGTGELENVLKIQVSNIKLAHKVIFHGFIPHDSELQELYRKCDLVIVPSLQDQSPKVILEGMAYCTPVIASNVGAIPQMIQDGFNGLLIPPSEPKAIFTKIMQVISDNEKRLHLIRNGFEYASDHTIEKETSRMMNLVSGFIYDDDPDNHHVC